MTSSNAGLTPNGGEYIKNNLKIKIVRERSVAVDPCRRPYPPRRLQNGTHLACLAAWWPVGHGHAIVACGRPVRHVGHVGHVGHAFLVGGHVAMLAAWSAAILICWLCWLFVLDSQHSQHHARAFLRRCHLLAMLAIWAPVLNRWGPSVEQYYIVSQ